MTTPPTYEQAKEELEAIVARLESPGTNLAEAMKLWERGEYLSQLCKGYLDKAEANIEAARTGESAAIKTHNS